MTMQTSKRDDGDKIPTEAALEKSYLLKEITALPKLNTVAYYYYYYYYYYYFIIIIIIIIIILLLLLLF